jgi:histidinol-phosphate phosphatase family protein
MVRGDKLQIDKSWTLFLDRDGVINRKLEGDYVKTISDFAFLPGVVQAIGKLSNLFGRIIIITNQQGIGKGLMTDEALETIHQHMLEKINHTGGRIDAVFFAPQLHNEGHEDRKPGIGMPMKAKIDFPEIEFKKSILIGDSITDMQLGRKLNMINIFISPKSLVKIGDELIDFWYKSLAEFSDNIE